MSAPNKSSTASRFSPPRSPTYAEALRAPKPAPINTNVSQGGFKSDVSTANTLSPAPVSTGWGSLRSTRTPATSLYPSSIWSPLPESTRSATIPKKLSWETNIAPTVSASPRASVQHGSMGLGFDFGAQAKSSVANATLQSPTRYQYQQTNLSEAQTSPFHFEVKDPNASTFPIMQRPFGSTREAADQHRNTSNPLTLPMATHPSNVPIGSEMKTAANKSMDLVKFAGTNPANKGFNGLNIPPRPDSATDQHDSSGRSAPSDLTVFTGSSSGKGSNVELIEQESHAKGFARHLREGYKPDNIVEAYDGGYTALKGLNGQFLELPPNARVICIKTDFVTNIHWSIKNKTWTAMTKVGNRIMRVWEASKADPGSKVYLLFSVNGQKSYCGLAEMSGNFTEGEPVSGWCKNNNLQELGTFPVTWHSLKNVSYSWFCDIHHSHNDGPITNMWNGMHFPHVAGLKVVRRYYRRPHFTNVLCWDKGGTYFPLKGNTQPEQIDPGLMSLRGGKSGQRWVKGRSPQLMIENERAWGSGDRGANTGSATGTNSTPINPTPRANGRQNRNVGTPEADRQEKKVTPSTLDRRGTAPLSVDTTTPPQLDGTSTSAHRPGQFVTCIVDANGNYVPVTPGGSHVSQMTIPGYDTPLVVHTHVHSPTKKQQYTLQGTPTPTRDHSGFSGGHGSGNVYSPAHSTLAGSRASSLRSHGTFSQQGIQAMNENLRGPEQFGTPHDLRPARSYGNFPPPTPTHVPGNRVVTAFQHHASPANYALQQGLPRQYSDSNMTLMPAGGPWPKAPSKAASPPYQPHQQTVPQSTAQCNVNTYLSKLQHGSASDEESSSGRTSTVPPSFTSRTGLEDLNEADLAAVVKSSLIASKNLLAVTHEISRRDYFRDPRRSDFPNTSNNSNGSEPGGLGCFVSTSSIEKERISPVPSLGGSVWDAEKEREFLAREKAYLERAKKERDMVEWETRVHADVERLLVSPEPSVVTDFDVHDGTKEGGVRLH